MRKRITLIVGLCALAAMAAGVGAWLWRAWGERTDVDVKAEPAPPPSAVARTGTAGVRVRPVKPAPGAVREGRVAPEASRLVRVIVGADAATARRYVARSRAVGMLGNDLSAAEVAALLGYLRGTSDVLRPERVAALKNDILNVLRAQRTLPSDLAGTLIAMFDSGAHDAAMLDYCVQHLGALQECLPEGTTARAVRDCLCRAALTPGASYAGTALIALTHAPDASGEVAAFLDARLAALLTAEDAHGAARVVALQLAGERRRLDLLPIARRIAADASAPVTERLAAIGAIGLCRQAEDRSLLESLRAAAPDPRLLPALDAALARLLAPARK